MVVRKPVMIQMVSERGDNKETHPMLFSPVFCGERPNEHAHLNIHVSLGTVVCCLVQETNRSKSIAQARHVEKQRSRNVRCQ